MLGMEAEKKKNLTIANARTHTPARAVIRDL